MSKRFAASDEFISWAQGLSGMLTTIRTKYGSTDRMIQRSDWDEGKTGLALNVLRSLRTNISKLEKEFAHHVSGKFG